MHQSPNRRDVLKLGAGLGLGALLASSTNARTISASLDEPTPAVMKPARKRLLRVAHLTDFHIQPERDAFKGVGDCLRHAQSLKDKPQAIVTGGDLIMDGYGTPFDRTKQQWDLWQKVLKDECSLPVFHTLGNHDIWGWDKKTSKTTGEDKGWGKAWACEMIGREKPYGHTDIGPVRVISIDSVQPEPDKGKFGYIGYCDDVQFAWLEDTLKSTPASTPIMIVSHIPIVSVTGLLGERKDWLNTDAKSPRWHMHADAPRLTRLFAKHTNIKACLAGHMHTLDRVEFGGVTYLCDGAVCAGWWKGTHEGTDAGYAIVDLFDDGSVEREYVTYGWRYWEA
jgi:3',5'-cyclic AMP phosphodiesterase CpdA